MKRLFIYGFFGIENAGNEAMLRALIEPIRDHFDGDIEFVVANRHPSDAYDKRYGVRTVQNLEYQSRDAAEGRWLRGLNPDDSPSFMEFLETVASSDVVIVGPGQYLVETGEYGLFKGALAQLATVVTACELTDVPCYGLALACEPIQSTWSKLLIRKVLPQFTRLTFRDPQSIENLAEAGIDVPSHEVLGDLALADTPASARLRERILEKEEIPSKSGPRLAVALRSIYWLDTDQEVLRKRFVDALTGWLERHPDGDILMIPQSVYNVDGDRDDDRVTHRRITEQVRDDLQTRIYEVRGEHAPKETESLYGGCDVTLSARLHGSVFSCKQGTPPVILTFMDKMRGYLDRIDHPECMMPLDASAPEVVDRLDTFMERGENLSRSILGAVDDVRSTARRYPEIASELLEQVDPERRSNRQMLFES